MDGLPWPLWKKKGQSQEQNLHYYSHIISYQFFQFIIAIFKVNICASWQHQHFSFLMSPYAGCSQFSCAAGGISGSFSFTTLWQPVWGYALKIHKDCVFLHRKNCVFYKEKKNPTIITTQAKCRRIAYLWEVDVHRLSQGTCYEAKPWYSCTGESHLINRSFTCALL